MILGVTGGMGAGKSELSRCLVSLGAHCLEADSVAHDLLESGADRPALRRRFGADIEDREGRLDRRLLGQRALVNEGSVQDLYAIIKPALEVNLRSGLRSLSHKNPRDIVVFDAPLLYEWGIEAWADWVVVVYADQEVRIDRVIRRTGLSRVEVERRMSLQMGEEEKINRADFSINNSGNIQFLQQQAETLWIHLTERSKLVDGLK